MSASAIMPYFIKPSVAFSSDQKSEAYDTAVREIHAILTGVDDVQIKMVTINCILKTHLPYYYWVGFYMLIDGRLQVGPYQGTLGCLYIDIGRGVCGRAAETLETQVVVDCHALAQGTAHIACDPNSQSEIVVPVFDKDKQLIAVFDVDSTLKESFCDIDKEYLERLMKSVFGK